MTSLRQKALEYFENRMNISESFMSFDILHFVIKHYVDDQTFANCVTAVCPSLQYDDDDITIVLFDILTSDSVGYEQLFPHDQDWLIARINENLDNGNININRGLHDKAEYYITDDVMRPLRTFDTQNYLLSFYPEFIASSDVDVYMLVDAVKDLMCYNGAIPEIQRKHINCYLHAYDKDMYILKECIRNLVNMISDSPIFPFIRDIDNHVIENEIGSATLKNFNGIQFHNYNYVSVVHVDLKVINRLGLTNHAIFKLIRNNIEHGNIDYEEFDNVSRIVFLNDSIRKFPEIQSLYQSLVGLEETMTV